MAAKRIKYLPELTYYYRINTGSNDHKINPVNQLHYDSYIRSKKPYPKLSTLNDSDLNKFL